MKNILVINVNWLGDVIFSTPVFRALKKAYPESHLSCLAVPRVYDILQSCPFVDEIIVYDEKGRHYAPWAKCKLVLELRKKKFDAAFLLHRGWTRALLVFLAGIPVRVGYDTKNRGWLLTHKVEPLAEEGHRSDHYWQVIESFGVKVEQRSCELAVDPQAKSEMEKMLAEEKISPKDFLVVVNAGGNWDLKRWPKENFAMLIKSLVTDLKLKVVIPGAAKDVALANEIVEFSGVKPVVLAGKTNLKQLIALLDRADLVISSDSGPLHMASAVGTNTIGIFGPTRPEITGPRGTGKSVILQKELDCNRDACYNLSCPDNRCMKAVTVGDVLEAVKEIAAGNK